MSICVGGEVDFRGPGTIRWIGWGLRTSASRRRLAVCLGGPLGGALARSGRGGHRMRVGIGSRSADPNESCSTAAPEQRQFIKLRALSAHFRADIPAGRHSGRPCGPTSSRDALELGVRRGSLSIGWRLRGRPWLSRSFLSRTFARQRALNTRSRIVVNLSGSDFGRGADPAAIRRMAPGPRRSAPRATSERVKSGPRPPLCWPWTASSIDIR